MKRFEIKKPMKLESVIIIQDLHQMWQKIKICTIVNERYKLIYKKKSDHQTLYMIEIQIEQIQLFFQTD